MASKAILRIEKLKTVGNIAGSASHVQRKRETPNADMTVKNIVLTGSGDIKADIEARLPEKRRKNSVLAVEHVLTASPEFFKDKTDEEIQTWAEQSVNSMKEFWGQDNVVSAVLHLDETTPHIHLYAVPIDHDTGRLNARGFIGGRQKLSALQDHYAKDMKQFNLERGIKGSKAKHTKVKQFYQNLENPPEIKHIVKKVVEKERGFGVLPPETKLKKYPSWKSARALQSLASQAIEFKKKAEQYKHTARSFERLNQQLEREKLREIPLVELAQELGLERDKHDRKKWKTPDGRHININYQKFYDLDEGKGGGGAIDFTMHILDTDFKSAIGWLKSRYGTDLTADEFARQAKKQVEQIEKVEFVPPERDDKKWPQVQAYLKGRGIELPSPTPTIYADKRGNAVFLGKGRAEIVGTGKKRFKGLAAGSSKDSSGFIAGDWMNAKYIAITESAIDAISYTKLFKDSAAVSTAGALPESFLNKFFKWVKALGKTPVIAFDNDKPGHRFKEKALEVAKEFFNINEIVINEPITKDWNKDLTTDTEQIITEEHNNQEHEKHSYLDMHL